MKAPTNKTLGFTIVELMIATSIFSVIMLISLYTFIRIGRYYTLAISIIRTQDATRNLEMDVANQIQLTSGAFSWTTLSAGKYAVCIGNKAYIYQANVPEDGNGAALASYDIAQNTACSGVPTLLGQSAFTDTKRVILRKGTRVLQLDIQQNVANLFDITTGLLYEPDQSVADLVDTSAGATNYAGWKCKTGISGSEYCALSRITTTVYKRVK